MRMTAQVFWGGECWVEQIYQRPDGRYTDPRPPNSHFCLEDYDRAELIGKTRVEIKVEDEDLATLTAPGQSFE